MDLKALIEKESDPKFQELRTRYENARIAVDLSYRLILGNASAPIRSIPDNSYLARLLAKEIETDLNATLKILEEPKEVKSV